MKRMKKSVSVILASIMLLIVAATPANVSAYTYSSGTRERLVEVAEGELGLTNGSKYGTSGDWCAAFANWCLTQAGATKYSTSFSTTSILIDYDNVGLYHAKTTTAWNYDGKSRGVANQDTNYTPRKGDVVLIETNSNWSDGPDHTALVVDVSGSGINALVYTIEGNSGGTVRRDYWQNKVWGYCSPSYNESIYMAFEAENLYRTVGRAHSGYCEANTGQDKAGYLVYGPYVTGIPIGSRSVTFTMKIDNNSADNGDVAILDVFDANSNKVLASTTIKRKQFSQANTYQNFYLNFTNPINSKLEFRVYYTGISALSVDKIELR